MDKSYWNTERLNRLYKDWPAERITELKVQIAKSNWRLGYHIQTETGLLNDPNGFSYFNGQWHMFFQAFPFGGTHGLKSWTHMVSDDLVHWKNTDKPMVPDTKYDRHGCYSGSAIPVGDKLFLMYTGNVWEKMNEVRHPYQDGAWMDKDNNITKLSEPLIANPPKGVTGHFRDPQVIKHGDYYYAFIGAQTTEEKGEVVAYRSKAVDHGWEFYSKLDIGNDNLGYMAECPNLLFVDGHPVLTFCPQGADKSSFKYDNVHPNAYIVADDINWETMKLINPSKMRQLDDGFDFYAAQGINAPDGRTLICGWLGLPDTTYPSDDEGWEGGLSMIRELSLSDNYLVQRPVKETKSLELGSADTFNGMELGKQSLVKFRTNPEADNQVAITAGNTHLVIDIDNDSQKLTLHRKDVENGGKDETRSIRLNSNKIESCELYLDNTVFELYINGGFKTMTGFFFHEGNHLNLNWTEVEDIEVTKLANIDINGSEEE
ncbi:sucrose-6-phosphate hydrolase [Lactobacillus sp. Sy-1]|uniref:sucrose-6-phosphate hydrolase n=1 Tax=Lactobacillus sp. Sy-1 TaxID=2109645 RepID=UPI001C55F9CA|nr:sucrose-6-phosphate hydrolase [Lactobacillus sp. Sy-1]MBW1604931.1 sucrose-6-phosphate hydrolase [Lactobacillus sp. Sy-1]